MKKENAISVSSIKIIGIQGLINILDFNFIIERNRHAEALLVGYLLDEECLKYLYGAIENKLVSIVNAEENESILFTGFIKDIRISRDEGGELVEVHLISQSYVLDQEKKSRSFQDISLTYKEIIYTVLEGYKKAGVIFNMKDSSINTPLIQYQESDWEFIKRIASLCKSALYADIYSSKLCIYCGLPEGSSRTEIDSLETAWGFDPEYYESKKKLRNSDALYKKTYSFQEIKSYQLLHLGDYLSMSGRGYIKKIQGQLVRGLLEFKYKIINSEEGIIPFYNKSLRGTAINGIVLDARGEKIRIHLNIDVKQENEKAFWFEWVPDINNSLYCMPQIGAGVSLFFMNEEEKNAIAINCVRPETTYNSELADFEKRYFVTPQYKKLKLYPQLLSLTNGSDKINEINEDDEMQVSIKSHKMFKIRAKEDIKFKAANIRLYSPAEISLVKKSILHPSVLNMCNRFDAIGSGAEIIAGGSISSVKSSKNKNYIEKFELGDMEQDILESTPLVGGIHNSMDAFIIGTTV